jgi:hypothetical protein
MAQIPPAEPVDQTSNQHSAPLAGGSNDRNLEATLSSVRTAVGRVATDGNRSAAELTLSTADPDDDPLCGHRKDQQLT